MSQQEFAERGLSEAIQSIAPYTMVSGNVPYTATMPTSLFISGR